MRALEPFVNQHWYVFCIDQLLQTLGFTLRRPEAVITATDTNASVEYVVMLISNEQHISKVQLIHLAQDPQADP